MCELTWGITCILAVSNGFNESFLQLSHDIAPLVIAHQQKAARAGLYSLLLRPISHTDYIAEFAISFGHIFPANSRALSEICACCASTCICFNAAYYLVFMRFSHAPNCLPMLVFTTFHRVAKRHSTCFQQALFPLARQVDDALGVRPTRSFFNLYASRKHRRRRRTPLLMIIRFRTFGLSLA